MKSEDKLHDLLVRLRKLERAVFGAEASETKRKRGGKAIGATPPSKTIDFSIPIRAFIRKHAMGMSGPRKFTLLVAHLTKGDANKKISLTEVKKQWNRMKSKGLLGMKFNGFYTAEARENDWVATEKTGSYHLRPSWNKIFNE